MSQTLPLIRTAHQISGGLQDEDVKFKLTQLDIFTNCILTNEVARRASVMQGYHSIRNQDACILHIHTYMHTTYKYGIHNNVYLHAYIRAYIRTYYIHICTNGCNFVYKVSTCASKNTFISTTTISYYHNYLIREMLLQSYLGELSHEDGCITQRIASWRRTTSTSSPSAELPLRSDIRLPLRKIGHYFADLGANVYADAIA